MSSITAYNHKPNSHRGILTSFCESFSVLKQYLFINSSMSFLWNSMLTRFLWLLLYIFASRGGNNIFPIYLAKYLAAMMQHLNTMHSILCFQDRIILVLWLYDSSSIELNNNIYIYISREMTIWFIIWYILKKKKKYIYTMELISIDILIYSYIWSRIEKLLHFAWFFFKINYLI